MIKIFFLAFCFSTSAFASELFFGLVDLDVQIEEVGAPTTRFEAAHYEQMRDARLHGQLFVKLAQVGLIPQQNAIFRELAAPGSFAVLGGMQTEVTPIRVVNIGIYIYKGEDQIAVLHTTAAEIQADHIVLPEAEVAELRERIRAERIAWRKLSTVLIPIAIVKGDARPLPVANAFRLESRETQLLLRYESPLRRRCNWLLSRLR